MRLLELELRATRKMSTTCAGSLRLRGEGKARLVPSPPEARFARSNAKHRKDLQNCSPRPIESRPDGCRCPYSTFRGPKVVILQRLRREAVFFGVVVFSVPTCRCLPYARRSARVQQGLRANGKSAVADKRGGNPALAKQGQRIHSPRCHRKPRPLRNGCRQCVNDVCTARRSTTPPPASAS